MVIDERFAVLDFDISSFRWAARPKTAALLL